MTLQVQIKTPTMWRTVSRVWKIQSSGAPRPQRGSPADRDVQLLTRDILLAMLNLTCVCVCMCRGIRMIYWRLIIHVSTVFPCSRNRKWRSPHLEDMWHQPTQGLVPLETSVTAQLDFGLWRWSVDATLAPFGSSFTGPRGGNVTLNSHKRNDSFTAREADFCSPIQTLLKSHTCN